MGKYLDKFRRAGEVGKTVGAGAARRVDNFANNHVNRNEGFRQGRIKDKEVKKGNYNFEGEEYDYLDEDVSDDDFFTDDFMSNQDSYDIGIKQAQKPASFHHFILQNKYKDLEMNIRGYKDVYNKDKDKWEIKRKGEHCFTDEEAEEILAMVQSHLATDIKLTFYSKETFGIRFLAVMDKITFKFRRIMEYKFGRFGDTKKQGEMKAQALQILVDVITRVEANYLMAIAGMENKRTHDAVRSQESLQGDSEEFNRNKGYS